MKYLFVLHELHRPRMSAALERGTNADWARVYRVSIVRRFNSLEAAKSYYLKATSSLKENREKVSKEIDCADRLKPKHDNPQEQSI